MFHPGLILFWSRAWSVFSYLPGGRASTARSPIFRTTSLDGENLRTANTYDSVGYYFNLDQLNPIELSFEKFALFDNLTILKHTENHINTYKYTIKAFYYFSSVLTNRKDNRLLMHCRHHYSIDGSRSGTGGSFWALFDGSTSNCTLVDILGLSEE